MKMLIFTETSSSNLVFKIDLKRMLRNHIESEHTISYSYILINEEFRNYLLIKKIHVSLVPHT